MYQDAILSGRAHSKNSRPQNIIYSGLLASGAAYLSGASWSSSLACYLLILLLYALATSFNNSADVDTDRLNSRVDNPLVTGDLTLKDVKLFTIVCLAATIGCLLFLSWPSSWLVAGVYLLLAFLYSSAKARVMSRGLQATLLLAVCYGSLPVILGLTLSSEVVWYEVGIHGLIQVGLLFPLLLAKDYKDLDGDRATGKQTPLVLYGASFVRRSALGVSVAAAASYVCLSNFVGIPLWAAFLAASIYVGTVYYLHARSGVVGRAVKFVLFSAILMMSLAIVYERLALIKVL